MASSSTSFDIVTIANAALVSIGESTILDIDENTPNAMAVKAKFELVKQDVLKKCNWNCARGTANLVRLGTTPAYASFDYAYTLPSDYIRLVGISIDGYQFINVDTYYNDYNNPAEAVYDLEGDTLYYDGTSCIIKYIKNIDVSAMDISCVRVLEACLAQELSYNRVASAALAQLLQRTVRSRLREARFLNGLELNPSRPNGDSIRAHSSLSSSSNDTDTCE